VQLRAADPPAQTLALIAGLALIEAIDAAMPAQPLMLKWPNDLLLLGRKLAGILLERTGDRVVVGFGVNLAVAPDLPDRRCAALGGEIGPHAFAPLLAASFARLLHLWRQSETGMVLQAWLARAHPIGTQLTVHSTGEKSVTGRFDGLEPDGALRLRGTNGELEIVRAGDVEL
jgi:BirA family biotin operon repressor/biotin-[acetyl-CoA-carboxylase] ligase